MMPSASRRTTPAGAVPARIASARTLLEELEPRPDGMTRIAPATRVPACGCLRSITSPVAGFTPPQKLRGSSRTKTRPRARPPTNTRTSNTPQIPVAPYPSGFRRTNTLGGAPEHDLDPDVAGGVVGPLRRVGHHNAGCVENRRNVGAGIDDDAHAGAPQDLQP